MFGFFEFDYSDLICSLVAEDYVVAHIRDLTLKQGIPGPKRVLVLEYG
jgi:hypothetical protein